MRLSVTFNAILRDLFQGRGSLSTQMVGVSFALVAIARFKDQPSTYDLAAIVGIPFLIHQTVIVVDNLISARRLQEKASLQPKRRVPLILCLLGWLRWFFDEENRKIVDLVIADILRDRRAMATKRCSPQHIEAVTIWRSMLTILSVLWNCLISILTSLAEARGLVNKIKH